MTAVTELAEAPLLAALRALYYGTMSGLQVPGDRLTANVGARVALVRNFEFRLPLTWLLAAPLDLEKVRGLKSSELLTTRLRLRFSLWMNRLPVDALPVEGWIELELLAEEDLLAIGG